MRFATLALSLGLASSMPAIALAAPPDADKPQAPPSQDPPQDARTLVPVIGYGMSAFGAARMTAGTQGYVGMLYGQPNPEGTSGKLVPQGGARIWGSPVDRLTLLLEVDKRDFSAAKPSATVAVRIFGNRAAGWAIGAALTYHTEGFANVAGEIEGALLASFSKYRFHADLNGVFGAAVSEREMDAEVKLRLGYDVTTWLRIGADGRFRMKVGDGKNLAGGRSYDVVGGPEMVFGYKYFFAALSGGPSTVGVAKGFGWGATTTVGAAIY